MVEASMGNGHGALDEKLSRLSNKPGVKASIVLDRASGAIIKTSGEVSALGMSKTRDAATAASFSNEVPVAEESEAKGLEDFAALVWNFVQMSGQLVQEVDKEDELRLLRLRTKKQEIVIVPDTKAILARYESDERLSRTCPTKLGKTGRAGGRNEGRRGQDRALDAALAKATFGLLRFTAAICWGGGEGLDLM
ncbi:hypothetical protein XA68_12316 [Ophiocordyceps unilateralis]|uniref:Roadblock/LAMTOR2 domain-containing protein n=1 Tax=Ophiocordyceps unilateralis TaxID=268505 RepID=A0A2A9PDG6_OPHUN|nr:hypothetical protein XA68_12316 [Ophiocordyceps unilateralis]